MTKLLTHVIIVVTYMNPQALKLLLDSLNKNREQADQKLA